MGRVPSLKRVAAEDFEQEYRPLIQKLAFIINSFHEQVRSTLNKNINSDNLAREIKVLSFNTGNTGQPLNTLTFKSGLIDKIVGINVIRLVITSNNQSYATQMPLISFSQNSELVTINNIAGLASGVEYRLTLETIT